MTFVFERALFVVGDQNSGKSVQLRSMQRDVRFGTNGTVPAGKGRLQDIFTLSNERLLHLRLSSPHESGDDLKKGSAENYLDKIENKLAAHHSRARRWNFAGALQPTAAKNMPDVFTTVDSFVRHFAPERVRVLFLSPDRHGFNLQAGQTPTASKLLSVSGVEVCWISSEDRTANGLLIADFFEFS